MDSGLTKPFLSFVRQLRLNEDVLLYCYALQATAEDEQAVADFLKDEFEKEALDFPDGSPALDRDAALWSAKTIYLCAQFILYREHTPGDLGFLLPAYTGEMNASAIVSADLCLRFLPPMIQQLKLMDMEDPLIAVIENHLYQWHYSGVSYMLDKDKLDFTVVTSDSSLFALYCNRITYYQNLSLATHPVFASSIRGSMGMYGALLWKEFTENDKSSVV